MTGEAAGSTPCLLSEPARSCVIQLAAALGSAPSATVSSNRRPTTRGRRPAPARPRASVRSRRRSARDGLVAVRAAPARISSIHSLRSAPSPGCRVRGSSGSRTLPPSIASTWWSRSPRPSGGSPARSTRRPRAPWSGARSRSASARSSERIEFMFLISTLVPNASVPDRPHRDVGVTAQRALLHAHVADVERLERGAELTQVGAGLLGRADVGLAHALDERHARTVEVDQRQRRRRGCGPWRSRAWSCRCPLPCARA